MESLIIDPGESHRRYEDEMNKMWKWASEAHRLIEAGNWETSLYYVNLCLSNATMHERTEETNSENFIINRSKMEHQLSRSELISLMENRCLAHVKLKMFDKVIQDAQTLLQLQNNHSFAYKCLLAALCKLNQLKKVSEVLKVWKVASPNNLEMIETRTKLEGLMEAVARGIEPRSAFSNVEDLLGLSCNSLSRQKTDSRWKYRPIPSGRNAFVLCLQYRFGHCSLGQKCPDAHGELELEEWKERFAIEGDHKQEAPLSVRNPTIIQSLLDRMANLGNESFVLSDDIVSHGIKIKPLGPLKVTLSSRKMKNYQWMFAVESKQPLISVCLLHEIHRQYFRISSAFRHESGSRFNLKPSDADEIPLQALEIAHEEESISREPKSHTYIYSFEILFSPELLGSFHQTVVFDFGFDPKPIKRISIEVYPPGEEDETDNKDSSVVKNGHQSASPSEEEMFVTRRKCTWNYGNAEIVNGANGTRVPSEKIGFALLNGLNKPNVAENNKENLTKENYKEKMRFFLTEEERARQEIISKYNVSAVLKISNQYSMTSGYFEGESKYAVDGGLFGRLTLFRDISEDTAVGRLILRSCNCVLLTKTEDAQRLTGKPRVYWCEISDKTKNAIYIQLGGVCVRELDLKHDDTILFDIQFQLDRTAFMEQKKVIDRLTNVHLDLLFPDFNRQHHIPWSPIMQWESAEKGANRRLNPKQKESLIAISCESSRIPPILLIGPFGTGKTFTLAQCIKRILQQSSSRIMICTQSNSAADLYIKEYLDLWVKEGFQAARPLRIYYSMRSFKTVHPSVIKYCIMEHGRFRNPTKEDIMAHRVIVVTLGTSYMLMELDLPDDTFSHIFLDEAAQAMESEAITSLMSAGENTKLVLAGDHMQLSPELFCDQAKNFHSSLLERLHCHYPESHPCKLMLCENYRSHASIIQFASEAFYNKKLECGMNQPVHKSIYPLTFYAARGEDVQEADSTSYFNMSEVFEVTEKVSEIISSWPESWGDYRAENAIGVLTPYADQVSKLRARLRKKGYTHVSVERVLNVQGKQFRVVILSTVRTHKPWVQILPEAVGKEVDLGFFSNPKLLNTALTRAQSLVAVVGDPVSLCTVGKCRILWEDFIRVCHENKSLHGISYVQLKQNILGVEMRLTWGLNPLANEFKPKVNSVSSVGSFSQSCAVIPPAALLKSSLATSSANNFYSQSRLSPIASNSSDVGVIPTSQLHSAYHTTGSHQSTPSLQSQYQQPVLPSSVQTNHVNPYQVINPQYGYCSVPVNPSQPQQMIRQYGLQPFSNYNGVSPVMSAMEPRFLNMMVQPAAVSPYFAPVPLAQVQSRDVYHPCGQGVPQQQQHRYHSSNAVTPTVGSYAAYANDLSQHNQQWNRDVLYQYQTGYSGQQLPLAKPFTGDIQRYAQPSPVNAQHVAGVPLYRRPAEVPSINSSCYPSASPAQNQTNKLQTSSNTLDKLSSDEITVLKDVLEKFSNSSGDSAIVDETMKSLYNKLGLSVSDAYNYSPGSVGSGNNPSVAPSTEINLLEHHRRRPHTTLDNPIAVTCGTNPVNNSLMYTNQHQRASVIPPYHSVGSSVQVALKSNNWFSNSGSYMNSYSSEEAKLAQSNTNTANSTQNLHSYPSSQTFRGLSTQGQNYLPHHHLNDPNGLGGYSHSPEIRSGLEQGSNATGNPTASHRSYANVVKQAPNIGVGTGINNNTSHDIKNQQYVALLPKLKQPNNDRIQLSKLGTSKQSPIPLQDISILNNYSNHATRNSNR